MVKGDSIKGRLELKGEKGGGGREGLYNSEENRKKMQCLRVTILAQFYCWNVRN